MTEPAASPTFGDYVATKRLGAGGQATAWRAHHRDDPDTDLLIKTFHIGVAEDWKTAELFERSARVLERLDHELIPAYRDHFQVELTSGELLLCMVREFVEGESLQERLDAGGSFDEDEVVDLTLWLLDVLEYLHGLETPVIHRDIKPANIIIATSGTPMLVDFGAVQAEVMSETGGSTIVGTAGYVAPEQLMGRAQPPSDLYALGVTILYLVTGISPTNLPSDGFELELPENLEVSSGLRHVIRRMTRADIDLREHSIPRLRRHLRNLEQGNELVVGVTTLPVKIPGESRIRVQEVGSEIVVSVPRRLFKLKGTGASSSSARFLKGFTAIMGVWFFLSLLPVFGSIPGIGFFALLVALIAIAAYVYYGQYEFVLRLRNDGLTINVPGYLPDATRDMVYAGGSYVSAQHMQGTRHFPYSAISDVRVSRWTSDDALALVVAQEQRSRTIQHATLAYLSHGEHIWLVRLIEARLEQWRELNPPES